MQEIGITLGLFARIEAGTATPWSAVTTRKITSSRACLSYGELQLVLRGMRVRRRKVADLSTYDIFTTRLGRTQQEVLGFLRYTGQDATHDTVISLVDWEYLDPVSMPVATERKSQHAIEDTHLVGRRPDVSLRHMISPFDTARDGDPVAVSFPFQHSPVLRFDNDASDRDFLILIKRRNELVIKLLPDMDPLFAHRYYTWLTHGVGPSAANVALGRDACHRLPPWVGRLFTATAFFFTDAVVAVSTTNRKLLTVSYAAGTPGAPTPMMKQYLDRWRIWPDQPTHDIRA